MKQLKVGDEVYFGGCNDGRGGHGAYATVTKINRRSITCTERQGSYRAGKTWRYGAGLEIAAVSYDGIGINGATGCMRTSWGILGDLGKID